MRKLLLAVSASLSLLVQPMVASASNLVASISISNQTMTVTQNGIVKHRWKVSTARKGYVTPIGNYRAKWASKNHRSRKYDNAPMPYAIFFHGGYAVHATYDLKRLGRPASYGCIRLHHDNGVQFFSMGRHNGRKNTKSVVTR